jgi:cytochrome c oxidase assembly protein subunit 17
MSVTEDHRSLQEQAMRAPADGRVGAGTSGKNSEEVGAKPKKICCACPRTKQARDECIVQNGEEACAVLIEAHKVCLRAEGFNV